MSGDKRSSTTQLRVGRLMKAHGLKGALKVELYTDAPERRFVPGATFSLQVPTASPWHGKSIELIELRWYNSHPVAFFVGVDDRNEAETLVKAILWIDADEDEEAEDDAWYDHQLVGLKAVRDGVEVGTVVRVDHLPAQDLLAIETLHRGEVLVPFVSAIVPTVDVKGGTIVLTPPAGLFEDLDEPADPAPAPEAAESSDSAAE